MNNLIFCLIQKKNGFLGLITIINKAMAERLNGKIQEIKSVSKGYRTLLNFKSAILFFHGGLNLYPLKW